MAKSPHQSNIETDMELQPAGWLVLHVDGKRYAVWAQLLPEGGMSDGGPVYPVVGADLPRIER